jgi:hypothetical protein
VSLELKLENQQGKEADLKNKFVRKKLALSVYFTISKNKI